MLSSPDILMDEAQRKAAAPKATPVLNKMLSLADEMAALDDRRQGDRKANAGSVYVPACRV